MQQKSKTASSTLASSKSASKSASVVPSVDVLIVGGGPTGLTLACLLQQAGISHKLVDAGEGPSLWSKAQIVHVRTLEQLQLLDMAAPLAAAGKYWNGMRMFDPQLNPIAGIDFIDLPSRFPRMLSISQRETELTMMAHYEKHGGHIHRKVKLQGFETDAEGITSELVNEAGSVERIRSRYVIGCDGAHSTVRHTLNLPFEGFPYEERLVQADVRVDFPMEVDDRYAVVFPAAGGLVGFLPLPGEKRYRLLSFGNYDVDQPLDLALFQKIAVERTHPDTKVSDPHWMVGFRIHCRQVPQYRVGNVFLCGDAAHIHSPAGGQGMNMGIQDAFNLGWKLEQVLKGHAPARLLDTYHPERHPVAATTLKATDTATWAARNVMGLSQPVLIGIRNSLLHMASSLDFVGEQASRAASMLETAYPQSPMMGEKRGSVWQVSVLENRNQELPSMRDWLDFRAGPPPGSRGPDLVLANEQGRLFDRLGLAHYTLLLFDGSAATREGYKAMLDIANTVNRRYRNRVQSVLIHPSVLPGEVQEASRKLCQTLHDPELAVHSAYGARAECLYLLRPDGYVAWRAQPVALKDLLGYLDQWQVPQPGVMG